MVASISALLLSSFVHLMNLLLFITVTAPQFYREGYLYLASFFCIGMCVGGGRVSLKRLGGETANVLKTGQKEVFRLQTTRRKRKRGPVCKPYSDKGACGYH